MPIPFADGMLSRLGRRGAALDLIEEFEDESGEPPASLSPADLVLAIYNPASVTRTWQVGAMRELLLAHRDPGIPVVIGRNVSGPVSGPNEDVRVVKLADLNPAEIDMRCLLIVGSSQTRWYSVDSQDRVFTPRRYPEAGRATATKSSRHSD